MSNPLNLKKAIFTRTNEFGVSETVTMSVRTPIVDYKNLSSNVIFEAFANENAAPIIHNLQIPLDLNDEQIGQAIAIVSLLIWTNAEQRKFIPDYEFVGGRWTAAMKSLTDLGAIIEDVEVEDLVKNVGTK